MQLTDTHCHIDLPIFDQDRMEILANCKRENITMMVVPGVCQSGWQNLIALCAANQALHPALGLHPMYMKHHTREHLQDLTQQITQIPSVALGEIGLDYYVKNVCHQKQQELFEAQLNLATRAKLPILLHVRKAHDQVLATLRRTQFKQGGIVHAYGGSLQQAKIYIEMGFKISFCGTVTYDRAKKIRQLAVDLSLKDIVIETDSPDLPPAVHHGERNTPLHLSHVVKTLAQLRNISEEQICTLTSKNARTALRISNQQEL